MIWCRSVLQEKQSVLEVLIDSYRFWQMIIFCQVKYQLKDLILLVCGVQISWIPSRWKIVKTYFEIRVFVGKSVVAISKRERKRKRKKSKETYQWVIVSMSVQSQQEGHRDNVHTLSERLVVGFEQDFQTKEEMSSLKCSLVSIDSFKRVQSIQISHVF